MTLSVAVLLFSVLLLLLRYRPELSVLFVFAAILASFLLLLIYQAWFLATVSLLFMVLLHSRLAFLYGVLRQALLRKCACDWHPLRLQPGRYRLASRDYLIELEPKTRRITGRFFHWYPSSDNLTGKLMLLCRWPQAPDSGAVDLPELSPHAARTLLGLDQQAGRRDILQSSRLLMSAFHPDRGGPPVLAVVILQARALLLAECSEVKGRQRRQV